MAINFKRHLIAFITAFSAIFAFISLSVMPVYALPEENTETQVGEPAVEEEKATCQLTQDSCKKGQTLLYADSPLCRCSSNQSNPVVIGEDGNIKQNITSGESTGAYYSRGEIHIDEESARLFTGLRLYLNGATGIALITLTLVFVIKCGQLAAAADNAQKRAMHVSGLIYILIAISALGAFQTIMAIIANLATKSFI